MITYGAGCSPALLPGVIASCIQSALRSVSLCSHFQRFTHRSDNIFYHLLMGIYFDCKLSCRLCPLDKPQYTFHAIFSVPNRRRTGVDDGMASHGTARST